MERNPFSLFKVCNCSHNNLGETGCLLKRHSKTGMVFNLKREEKWTFLLFRFLIYLYLNFCMRLFSVGEFVLTVSAMPLSFIILKSVAKCFCYTFLKVTGFFMFIVLCKSKIKMEPGCLHFCYRNEKEVERHDLGH